MIIDWLDTVPGDPETEADFAVLRNLGRTTVGKSFPLRFGSSSDVGRPARTVWQIISEESDFSSDEAPQEGATLIHESPSGRVQVKARIVGERGRVKEIRFERVTGIAGRNARLESLLNLNEAAVSRLIDLCIALKGIDPSGTETLKFDEGLMEALMADPNAVLAAYRRDPTRFRDLIASDVSAGDVIAIAARKAALSEFRLLLHDSAYFERMRGERNREGVWQRFFERNKWILGVGLSGHLYTSWDARKLEKTVAGASIGGEGKRVDALLTTSGLLRSLVFAEIKLHDDPLVSEEFRSGCWPPSPHVTNGVAQSQATTQRARSDLSSWLNDTDVDGFSTGRRLYAGWPRSYLVIGTLESLTAEGRPHEAKFRSFEDFRSSLKYPEIITYDELLARAEWSVLGAENSMETE